jgi:hypothetical protein
LHEFEARVLRRDRSHSFGPRLLSMPGSIDSRYPRAAQGLDEAGAQVGRERGSAASFAGDDPIAPDWLYDGRMRLWILPRSADPERMVAQAGRGRHVTRVCDVGCSPAQQPFQRG